MSKEETEIVATVDKYTAIDQTPIYMIMVTKNIPAGAILEFDTEKIVITRSKK